MSSLEPVPEREPGLESAIPPLILVRVREEPDDHEIDEAVREEPDHEIDAAVYSEPTPNQEVVSCGNIETPSTDPVMRKRGRPFKNKGPMKKQKGKLFKKTIIRGAGSSPPIPATSSAPSTDSERMQLSTFSESLSIRRNPRSLRTKKQPTVSFVKGLQGGSAEKPLENRADEAPATGLIELADAAMAEESNGILNNAYPGSSDIAANEPGSSEAVDVSISPQYHDLYRKISAHYGSDWIGNFCTSLHKTRDALTENVLETISAMMQTKPLEVSLNVISQWEKTLNFASMAGFKIGWLFDILHTMRVYASGDYATEEMVQDKEKMIQELKAKEKSTDDELKAVQQRLTDLQYQIAKACSELEGMKNRQVSTNLFGDLK